jgi:hypothetical protein
MKYKLVNQSFFIMLLALLAVAAGCSRQPVEMPVFTFVRPTPFVPMNIQHTPTPIYSPQAESFVPESDTIVTGEVMESSPQFQLGEDVYKDWLFKVESYITNPLPQGYIKVRIWEQAGKMPIKGVHLNQGEHLLLALKIDGDHFVMAGGLMGAKFIINGEHISYGLIGNSPQEKLAEVISRIKIVADTWAKEKLTNERMTQLTKIATGDSGIKEFLNGKDFEIGQILPTVEQEALSEIRYMVSINIPKNNQPEVQLSAMVNFTRQKVDKIQVNLGYTEYQVEVINQLKQIALADPIVQGLIGNRAYNIAGVNQDSWQDNIDGKTVINIYPKVEIWLQPEISNILSVYVGKSGQVVKIFNESYISLAALESNDSDRDFKLSVQIPKAEYSAGELVKATLTLSYFGGQPVELSSPTGHYFDLLIRDDQNNIIYQWERLQAGLPASLPAPTTVIQPSPGLTGLLQNSSKVTLNPGESVTSDLEFMAPSAGIYYLRGRNFGSWDFGEIFASYPNGSGYGLHLEAPFIFIQAR